MLRTILAVLFLACLLTLTAAPVPVQAAAPEVAAAPAAGTVNEIASFSVPGLNKLLALRMARALASQPGLVKALPSLLKKQLDVEFIAPTTNPKALLAVLAGLDAGTKLQGVRPVGAEAGAKAQCNGCPLKGVCGEKH